MKKKSKLNKVRIDGTLYNIIRDVLKEPLTEEAMIIFARQLIILNQHEDNPKTDMAEMDDLMHEIMHGVVHHRLYNFKPIIKMKQRDQETLVQELGRGVLLTLLGSPELLEALVELSKKNKD